mmetsp:Transcript_55622/g.77120  ORF Transcript_55622/g.77120 Transcript_55622/m.77120 type:complete len:305 (-) Transcript_55622:96-1010(-)
MGDSATAASDKSASKSASASPEVPDVVSRLTDPSKYTGSHAERFNADGTGRGKAGREDLIDYDGSTNATQRKTITSQGRGSRVVVKKWDGKKFGTQADMPRRIKVFAFGNYNDEGTVVVLNHSVKNIKQVLARVPNLPTGRPKKIIQQDLRTKVKDLDGFKDGGQYLAVPTPAFKVQGPETQGIPKRFEYIERKKDLVYDKKKAAKMWPNLKSNEFVKAAEQFEVYDQDGNGLIDIQEISSCLVSLGFDVVEDKIEGYLEEFDVDGNHALDIYEFFGVVNKAKMEPGSENLLVQGIDSSVCSVM